MKARNLAFATELTLPIDMATETFGFLGKKGKGKTYGAQKLFELLHAAGVQCVALDPVGNWWSLRVGKDGKSPGLPVYVFGGPRGDVPILPDAGAFVARVIVEKRISVILDVSRFRKAERKRFMTAFAEEFFHLKKDAVSPVHLFIEEAHKFVPQMVRDGEEQMLGAMEDIVRIGRNYGIGASLISQRSASVNKDVLSQVECLVAYQTSGRQDKKAIVDWVEENDEEGVGLLAELKSLQRGEALFWSPSSLRVFKKIHINAKVTLDASSTPKVGSRARKPVQLARVDLKGIETAMQQVVVQAEANDVGALKRKLAEALKRVKTLEETPVAAVTKLPKTEKAKEVVPIIPQRQLDRLNKVSDKLLASQDRMNQCAQVVVTELGLLMTAVKNASKQVERVYALAPTPKPPVPKYEAVRPLPKAVTTYVDGEVPVDGPMKRMLGALEWFHGIGIEQPTAVAVAFMSGYSGNNGTFRNVRGKLNTAGLIEYPRDGHLRITRAGKAHATPLNVSPGNDGLQRAVLQVLNGPQRRMLEVLINAYPRSVPAEGLAVDAGYEGNNGTFRNVRGRLHTYGLIEYPNKGMVKAVDILFPEGG